VVVFVHGVYVTGAIWDRVIAVLGDRVRSIAPTWPLGAHHPVHDGVDLAAAAAARRVVRLLEVLDLRGPRVTGQQLAAYGADVIHVIAVVCLSC